MINIEQILAEYSANFKLAYINNRKDNAILRAKEAKQGMVEFAKLHVKAALKAAAEKARMTGIAYGNDKSITDYEVDRKSILKAYNIKQIK